jgi:tetratricopeptide (TPR) repeat protein
MTHSLASARALLEAKSYPAARRSIQDMLKERPNDTSLLTLAVEIEVQAGDHKKALELVRQALQTSPDNAELREQELMALGALRRKGEARDALKRFAQDFPHQRWRIDRMTIMVDSLYGRGAKLKLFLDEFGETTGDHPSTQRDLGIAYHKINDLYQAQRLMLAAHPHFADDIEINEALAANSFQLVRPAAARKFANLALSASPHQGRMRLLRVASYFLYLPPFFVLGHCLKLAFTTTTFLGRYGPLAVGILIAMAAHSLNSIWLDLISVAARWPVYKYDIVILPIFLCVYLLATNEDIYRKIIPKHRSIKVRNY